MFCNTLSLCRRTRKFTEIYRQQNMKKIPILFLFIIANVFSETKYDSLQNNLALEAFLHNRNKSMVVSSLLVKFPLCKLASIAQGTSRSELLSILGIKSDTTLQSCFTKYATAMAATRDIDLVTLNKIIVNYTDDIRQTFISTSTLYGVKVDKVGFNYPKMAALFLNRWIDRASIKRISDVLEPNDIDNKTSIIIINAAYLKVTWEFPFDIRLTKLMKFHHHNGSISMVPMMTKTDNYLYLNDEVTDAQYVNLKLASVGLSITIAVPTSSRHLYPLLHKLSDNSNNLKGVYRRMRFELVTVMLPRFRIKSCIELNPYLQRIGLLQVFNETNSGLNEILVENSKVKNIYLSKVKQKTFIDVDEMGIFRHATDDYSFNDPYPIKHQQGQEIIADRPFFFTINLQTDITNHLDMPELFTGVYYGPNT